MSDWRRCSPSRGRRRRDPGAQQAGGQRQRRQGEQHVSRDANGFAEPPSGSPTRRRAVGSNPGGDRRRGPSRGGLEAVEPDAPPAPDPSSPAATAHEEPGIVDVQIDERRTGRLGRSSCQGGGSWKVPPRSPCRVGSGWVVTIGPLFRIARTRSGSPSLALSWASFSLLPKGIDGGAGKLERPCRKFGNRKPVRLRNRAGSGRSGPRPRENARLRKKRVPGRAPHQPSNGFKFGASTQRPPKIRKMPRRGWLGRLPLVLAMGLSLLAVIRDNSGARPASYATTGRNCGGVPVKR